MRPRKRVLIVGASELMESHLRFVLESKGKYRVLCSPKPSGNRRLKIPAGVHRVLLWEPDLAWMEKAERQSLQVCPRIQVVKLIAPLQGEDRSLWMQALIQKVDMPYVSPFRACSCVAVQNPAEKKLQSLPRKRAHYFLKAVSA